MTMIWALSGRNCPWFVYSQMQCVASLTQKLWKQINLYLPIHRCCSYEATVIVLPASEDKVPEFPCQWYWFYLDLRTTEAVEIQSRNGVELRREYVNAGLQDWTTGHLLVICQAINNLDSIINWFSKLNVHVLVLQLQCYCWWVLQHHLPQANNKTNNNLDFLPLTQTLSTITAETMCVCVCSYVKRAYIVQFLQIKKSQK